MVVPPFIPRLAAASESIVSCISASVALPGMDPNKVSLIGLSLRFSHFNHSSNSYRVSRAHPGKSHAHWPQRIADRSSFFTCSVTVAQFPICCCLNSLALGYHGLSFRSNSHRQSGS